MTTSTGSVTEAVAACKSALATLQRLGRSDLADGPLTDAESNSYSSIAADRDHSDSWKLQRYAQTYTNVMTELARKLTAAANLAGTQDQDDAAKVFGTKGLAGDPASLAISRRDARDRVAAIDLVARPDQLSDLLADAVRSGDDVLAHAVAEAAITNGDEATADQFQAAYPNLADAVDRLWAAQHRRMNGADIVTSWRVGALRPEPIHSLQDYEVDAAAAGQTGPGAANSFAPAPPTTYLDWQNQNRQDVGPAATAAYLDWKTQKGQDVG